MRGCARVRRGSLCAEQPGVQSGSSPSMVGTMLVCNDVRLPAFHAGYLRSCELYLSPWNVGEVLYCAAISEGTLDQSSRYGPWEKDCTPLSLEISFSPPSS